MEDWLGSVPEVMESMIDALWGTSDYRDNALKRQDLHRKAYIGILGLWNALSIAIVDVGDARVDVGDGSPVAKALQSFQDRMREVFADFEIDVNYAKIGLLEKWSQYASKQMHRTIASNDSLSKELQYEFEKFWDDFFELIRKPSDDQKYEKNSLAAADWIKNDQYMKDQVANYPAGYLAIMAHAGSTITDIAADSMRISLEQELNSGEMNQKMAASSSSDLLSEYSKLVSQKIGDQLSDSEAMKVATSVVDSIAPAVMEEVVAQLNARLTGGDLAILSQGLPTLVLIHYFYEFRWAIDNMIRNDADYRLLMGLEPVVEYQDEEQFVIMELFHPGRDFSAMAQLMADALDPTGLSVTRQNVLSGMATRIGGIPAWAIKDPILRKRAGDVFVQRISFWVSVYITLSERIRRRDESFTAEALEKLKKIVNLKEGIYLEDDFKGWGITRLISNLEIELPTELNEIAYYSARYMAADLRFEIEYHIARLLSAEFLQGVQYFAAYAAQTFKEPRLNQLYETTQTATYAWWPWGTIEGDVFSPKLNPDCRLRVYRAFKPGVADEISDSFAQLVATIKALNPNDNQELRDAMNSIRVKVLGKVGVNEIEFFNEIGRLILQELVVGLANQWAEYYEGVATDTLFRLQPSTPTYSLQASGTGSNTAERMEFAKNLIRFVMHSIREIILSGGDHVINLADFKGRIIQDSAGLEMPEEVVQFIYYQNIATNLEYHFSEGKTLQGTFYDDLEGSLSEFLCRLLEAELPNELKRVSPDLRLKEDFNPMIEYDDSTFDGVVSKFMRNVTDTINRSKLAEA